MCTLEEDLELLKDKPGKPQLTWQRRMAILYRSEQKKIIRSQLNIIKKVDSVLEKIESTLLQKGFNAGNQNIAYTELLM